jgi:hypothetical protein
MALILLWKHTLDGLKIESCPPSTTEICRPFEHARCAANFQHRPDPIRVIQSGHRTRCRSVSTGELPHTKWRPTVKRAQREPKGDNRSAASFCPSPHNGGAPRFTAGLMCGGTMKPLNGSPPAVSCLSTRSSAARAARSEARRARPRRRWRRRSGRSPASWQDALAMRGASLFVEPNRPRGELS